MIFGFFAADSTQSLSTKLLNFQPSSAEMSDVFWAEGNSLFFITVPTIFFLLKKIKNRLPILIWI
jgi:patatin-like phospholipase/acyl hydrolase